MDSATRDEDQLSALSEGVLEKAGLALSVPPPLGANHATSLVDVMLTHFDILD